MSRSGRQMWLRATVLTVVVEGRRLLQPAVVCTSGNADVHGSFIVLFGYAWVTVSHNRLVNLIGHDDAQRCLCLLEEVSFDLGRVEQPKGKIEGLAEAALLIVVHFAGVYHGTEPQSLVGGPLILVGESGGQSSYDGGQQFCFGHVVGWMDKGEDSVAAVDEWVTVVLGDAARAKGVVEHVVHGAAQGGLGRVGSVGGVFDVDGEDGAVSKVLSSHGAQGGLVSGCPAREGTLLGTVGGQGR
jgi:hypothetical protein